MTINVRSLRQEHADLNRLMRELTEQRVAKVMRDDHTTTTHTAPSLLEELREAVAVGGESTGMGAAVPGSRLPIAPNAADALTVIEERVLRMQLTASKAGGASIEARLRLVQSIVVGWADPGDVAWACAQLRGLVAIVEDVLSPVSRFEIRRACPVCGADWVSMVDDLGETVLQPALVADSRHGAQCRACLQTWPAELDSAESGAAGQSEAASRE
jgi:hypothetical protein